MFGLESWHRPLPSCMTLATYLISSNVCICKMRKIGLHLTFELLWTSNKMSAHRRYSNITISSFLPIPSRFRGEDITQSRKIDSRAKDTFTFVYLFRLGNCGQISCCRYKVEAGSGLNEVLLFTLQPLRNFQNWILYLAFKMVPLPSIRQT